MTRRHIVQHQVNHRLSKRFNDRTNCNSMNTIIFTLFALAAYTLAAPSEQITPIVIVSQSNTISPDGTFKSEFETANGIKEEMEGTLKVFNQTATIPVVKGFVSWTAPDGTIKEFTYTADENGYHPEGEFLPTTPEVPHAIARALEYIRLNPEPTTV